jgi:REP-associated tyrosine transposase
VGSRKSKKTRSAITSTEIRWGYCKLVPQGLHRYYGAGYLHFLTTSCYRRLPLLGRAKARDLFVGVLEQVRRRYHFVVVGFVVMPEHVHLLISEPERGNPSTVMQVVKQSFARRLLRRERQRWDARQGVLWDMALDRGHVWQRRFYDFVVWKERKRVESCATCIVIRLPEDWC